MTDQATVSDVELAGASVQDMTGYRNGGVDFIFDIDGVDLSAPPYNAEIFDRRGGTSLYVVAATVTVETKTFQAWVDDGYYTKQQLPYDMQLSDNWPISTVRVVVGYNTLASFPSDTTGQSGKVTLHWELYAESDRNRIVDGKFVLLG